MKAVREMAKKGAEKDRTIREWRVSGTGKFAKNPYMDEQSQSFGDSLRKDTLKEMKERVQMIKEFKAMEPYLSQKEREEYKRQLGLIDEEGNDPVNESAKNDMMPMLMQMLQKETDPEVRKQLMMAMTMQGNKTDPNMMYLAMMLPDMKRNENPDNVKDKIFEKLLEEKLDSKNNDPLQQMEIMTNVIQKAQELAGGGGSDDSLDKHLENMDKYKKLGWVSDPQKSVEERKLDLDFKKFEYEKDMEKEREQTRAEREQSIIKQGMKALPHLFKVLGKGQNVDMNEEPEPRQEEESQPEPEARRESRQTAPKQTENTPEDAMVFTCRNENCKRQFTIPEIYRPRELICPNVLSHKCDRLYRINKDTSLTMYQITGEDLENVLKEYGVDESENGEGK